MYYRRIINPSIKTYRYIYVTVMSFSRTVIIDVLLKMTYHYGNICQKWRTVTANVCQKWRAVTNMSVKNDAPLQIGWKNRVLFVKTTAFDYELHSIHSAGQFFISVALNHE